MEADNMKLVDFEKYCPHCSHINEPDSDDPCHECLQIPARQYSHKPEKYDGKFPLED